jgi:hypothetical protein
MRTTSIAPVLAVVLSACQGAAPERADGTSTDATSSSTTAGGAGGAASSCTLTVSGAVSVVSVTTPDGSFVSDVALSCGMSEQGWWNSLNLALGPLHGPGEYTSLTGPGAVHEYQITACAIDGPCTTTDTFGDGPDSAGCTAVLGEAPAGYVFGARVAGSFVCPELVDDADPTRWVAVSGTFSVTVEPPPI